MNGVFVANRGEIAARIARTVHALGLPAFGAFAPEDAASPHRTLLDACYPLEDAGGFSDIDTMVALARRSGARFVHPGYGFLSQEPAFAQAVAAAGLTFVGPSAEAMRAVGDKGSARALARSLGVPVIEGQQDVRSLEAAKAAAHAIGYPVLVKAPNAGGGRGLVRAQSAAELPEAWAQARRVAGADTPLVLETWLPRVRHLEVQVAADGRRALALGTRDCSSQRRLQKVLEEAPAAHLPPAAADAMQRHAERLLASVQYRGVGTVEFLADAGGRTFFLEVNPRLQVEHTITEEVAGIDLVAWQLSLAAGEALPAAAPAGRGHAIEARLLAEDPGAAFAPQGGTVLACEWPQGPGIRVDAGIAEGTVVGSSYDSLMAKVVAWAPTRAQARRRLVQALRELRLLGVMHNVAHLLAALEADAFVADDLDTGWLERLPFVPPAPPEALADAGGEGGIDWTGPAEGPPAAAAAGFVSPLERNDHFGRTTCSAAE